MAEPEISVPISHLRGVVLGLDIDPEPIDLAHVTGWNSWTWGAFKCLYCNGQCDYSYEVVFQWGDTRRFTYVKEMCPRCLSSVCKKSRNATTSRYVIE